MQVHEELLLRSLENLYYARLVLGFFYWGYILFALAFYTYMKEL